MDIIRKTQNTVFVEDCCMRGYNFYKTFARSETATPKTSFSIPARCKYSLRLK